MELNLDAPRPTPEKRPRDSATLINEMVRLIDRLAEHPIFKQANLGLTEWCFLRTVAESEGLGGGRVAGRLGITPQRSAQIANALVAAKYVNSTPSADDGRRKILTITEHGRTTVAGIDRQIAELFQQTFPDVTKAVAGTSRNVRKLLQAISQSEKGKKSPD